MKITTINRYSVLPHYNYKMNWPNKLETKFYNKLMLGLTWRKSFLTNRYIIIISLITDHEN